VGTEAEGTVWKEIELSSIINETNLPDAGVEVVVEELKEAIADVSRSELHQQGQIQLHFDDAVLEMVPESPGNASFPTLQEWADKGANAAENAVSKRLRERVRTIAGKHTWKVAKRKNSAFAPNEEKPLKSDLLFIALNKFLEETALSLVGMLGNRNELKFVLSSELQMQDAGMEEAPEAGSMVAESEEMSLDSFPAAQA